MKLVPRFIVSAWVAFWIHLQRQVDHTYRKIIGVPILRYSEITPQLYLGGQYTQRGYHILQKRGITGIVSMRTRARADLPPMKGVELLHLPTPDEQAPSMAALRKGVRFIKRHLKNGGKVYVHCAYGEGRGPSMMAAYLMSTGLTLKAALAEIIKVRGFIRPSRVQLDRLKEFEQEVILKS